jgi:hypothetical protein
MAVELSQDDIRTFLNRVGRVPYKAVSPQLPPSGFAAGYTPALPGRTPAHPWAARQARDALVDRILAWVELPILHWSTEWAYTPETLAAASVAALAEAPAA